MNVERETQDESGADRERFERLGTELDQLRLERDLLSQTLGAVVDGVSVQAPDGSLLYVNQAAVRLIGFDSSEQLMAAPTSEVLARFDLLDEGARPLASSALPGRIAALEKRPAEAVVCWRVKATGDVRWSVINATPVFDPMGRLRFVVNIFRDITEMRRAHEAMQQARADAEAAQTRLMLLAEASTAFAEASLDYERLLEVIARRVGDVLGDGCIVRLLSPDRQSLSAAAFHDPNPEAREALNAVIAAGPIKVDEGFLGGVIRTGEPLLIREIDDSTARRNLPAAHGPFFDRFPLRSLLVAPLRVYGRAIGALVLVRHASDRPYGRDDLMLAQELSDRAALAIHAARSYAAERDARARTEAAMRAREELMATVSHDLRSPLGVINMAVNVLVESLPISDPEHRASKAISAVRGAAGRMQRLILDLLDLARLDAGTMPLERALHPVASLFRHTLDLFEPLAAEKSLQIEVAELGTDGAVLEVICDRDRILQVLSNLVGNAIKFTPPGHTITLGARAVDGSILMSVADTGHGIDSTALPRVFERYFQAQPDDRRGVGLGLAIARGIVEAHGGAMWIESSVGIGTTVFFTLPSKRPD